MLSNPVFSAALAAVLALLGKFVWDRYFSQSSRITQAICELRRKTCVAEMMIIIKQHTDRLQGGDRCFQGIEKKLEKIDSILSVLLFTNLQVSRELKIDCDEIARVLMQKGVIE